MNPKNKSYKPDKSKRAIRCTKHSALVRFGKDRTSMACDVLTYLLYTLMNALRVDPMTYRSHGDNK